MYWKVLILEIKDKYCLAMKEDGSVVRIIKKPQLKEGDSIYIIKDDLYEKEHKIKMINVRKITAVAAAIAIFAMVLSIPQFAEKAYATVSFDGKKSVEVTLNKNNKIMEARSYDNTLSEDELSKLKGKDVANVAQMANDFDEENGSILVAYGPMRDEGECKELEEELKAIIKESDAIYLRGDKEDVKGAYKAKKSLGIYIIEKGKGTSNTKIKKFMKKYGYKTYSLDDKAEVLEEKIENREEILEEKNEAREEKEEIEDKEEEIDEDDKDDGDDENKEEIDE